MTGLNYVRNLAGGFLDDACRRRSQALRTVGRAPIGGFFRLKYRSGSPTMSHVIPLWLVQMLNLHCWNCNVFGACRKMTALNYVRNLAGGGVVAAHGRRSQARGRYDPDPPRTSSCLPSITFEAATSWLPKNVARNSPAISSNFEFMSLELQRFRVVSKNDRGKLRAKFGWRWCRCRRHRHRN